MNGKSRMMNISFVPNKLDLISQESVHKYITKSYEKNHFANSGPCVSELEDQLRQLLKISNDKAVIVTNSGTSAMHSLVGGLIINHGKLKFATQSFTFPSNIVQLLSNSEIVDIDLDGGINLNHVKSYIDGIIVTNPFGHIVNIDYYTNWTEKNNKFLIFDNASTPYTFYMGQNTLNFGTGSIISLHHTKPIGFGEGGVVIIDKKYEDAVRDCINLSDNKKNPIIPFYSNFKMSDISAAYILSYLENFEKIKEHHLKCYEIYKNRLNNIEEIKLFPNASVIPFCSCFPVLFNKTIKVDFFEKYGIAVKKYYTPLINTKVATDYYNRILCFPLHINIKNENIKYITELISKHPCCRK